MTVFQTLTPLELLQFFILEVSGSYFVDDTELLGAALVFKNVILQQSFCVYIRQSDCIFSAISVTLCSVPQRFKGFTTPSSILPAVFVVFVFHLVGDVYAYLKKYNRTYLTT